MRAKLNTSCSPAPARSTGFAVGAVGGSSSRSVACVGVREQRQLEPVALEQVARDRAVAAAVADHGDPSATGPVRREERLRRVDERARRVHEMDPAGTARRLDRLAAARQRAGVGARGASDPPRVRPTVSRTTGLPAVRAASTNARPSRKSSQ